MYGDNERRVICSVMTCVLELLYPHMVYLKRTSTRFRFVSWNIKEVGEITLCLQRTALIHPSHSACYNSTAITNNSRHRRHSICDGFMLFASHKRASRRLRKLSPIVY